MRTCFNGLGKLSTNSKILVTTLINVVLIAKNWFPTVASWAFNPSTALLYLPDADSVTAANSRSASAPRSAVEAFIKSKTCKVWLPCFPKFSKRAFILANWNLPKRFSIACCFCNGFNWSKASCNASKVFVVLPALSLTIASKSMPNDLNWPTALSVGLIKEARPDLSAFAPSAALIPPSRIAVK